MLMTFLITAGVTWASLLLGTAVLHGLPRLGNAGHGVSAWLSRAPGLDGVVTYFIALPPILAAIFGGWVGLAGAILGQCIALQSWVVLHELAHPQARKGPRILKAINRIVGRWRNHAALWVTLTVAPMFWVVRVAQYLGYPPLVWLVKLPPYDSGAWVNVTRHKFDGLVGHDRIWCLYCDWMTGVWSLGSEMLRNVESLWCPLRFGDAAKCENCRIDFPDIEGGDHSPAWLPAHGDMAGAQALVEQQYEGVTPRAWWGHPSRLTIERQPILPAPTQHDRA